MSLDPADLKAITWLSPWQLIDDARAATLERELQRELSSPHVLHARPLRAIAARVDQDDVLYLVASPDALAVVHLSYRKETRPEFPACILFESVDEFVEGCMKPDHLEHTDEDD